MSCLSRVAGREGRLEKIREAKRRLEELATICEGYGAWL